MSSKYSAEDVVLIFGTHVVTGFTDGSLYQSPKLWHTAYQLESGNWKVSVEHKGNRRMDVELSDENYKKYGIDRLEPTVENPFKINYDDADLIEVSK